MSESRSELMNRTTISRDIKNFLVIYILPSEIIAKTFPVVLGGYVTVLAFVSSLAINDAQDNLNNATLFQLPGFREYYSYVVENYIEFQDNYTITVSNAVLWVCRKGSSDGDFYRIFYIMAIVFLIIFHLFTAFGRFFTPQFWKKYEVENRDDMWSAIKTQAMCSKTDGKKRTRDYDDKNRRALRIIIGAILFNVAFLMLLLSFDISSWSCMHQPSKISYNYIPQLNRFDIQIDHTPSAIEFQKGASYSALILSIVWVIAHVIFFLYDLCYDIIDLDIDESCRI